VHIAQQYLVPKQMEANGLTSEHLTLTPTAVHAIATGYTMEAGVRQIDRELAAVCRCAGVGVCACACACVAGGGRGLV
jgi:ATP-dependent Lon protease